MTNFTDLTEKRINDVLEGLANGWRISKACRAAGISRQTFYNWKNSTTENIQRVLTVMDNSRQIIAEDALFNQVIKGNVTAIIFYLCNRDPKRWKRNDSVEELTPTERPQFIVNITSTAEQEVNHG